MRVSFLIWKETSTARRNQIQQKLMEALQAFKLSSRNNSLNLTKPLSPGFYPLEGDGLELCEALEASCNAGILD